MLKKVNTWFKQLLCEHAWHKDILITCTKCDLSIYYRDGRKYIIKGID